MSLTPDGTALTPVNSTTTVVTGGSDAAASSNAKRSIFRKKKSTPNLRSSSSSTLASQISTHHSGASVDSFDDAGVAKKKTALNPFKRKSKNELAGNGNSIGSIEESGADQDDNRSLVSFDSEPESDAQDPALLSSTSSHATVSELKPPTKRPNFFSRRSTSPLAPTRSTTFAVGEVMGTIPSGSKENTRHSALFTAEGRPSTSGGELSRTSEDRGRRSARSLTIAAESTDIPPVPPLMPDQINAREIDRKAKGVPPTLSTNFLSAPGLPETGDGAPETTITPPTPTDFGGKPFAPKSPAGPAVNGEHTGHRAASSSNAPSKLSQSMTLPVTPTASDSPGVNNAGFFSFSSMFSAAQNAATSVTNVIPNLGNNAGTRSRSGTQDSADAKKNGGAEVGAVLADETRDPEKESAVKTLGMGELSLGSLGIQTNPEERSYYDPASDPTGGAHNRNFSAGEGLPQNGLSTPQEKADGGLGTALADGGYLKTPMAEDAFLGSPRGSRSQAGDTTPDGGSTIGPDDDDLDTETKRSNSVKSGENAAGKLQRIKPTGFAVTSGKRNRDFHNIFKSVPSETYLIEDYGCALQRDILLQGRLYVSETHICFYSNIFGWVTQLVISFNEVLRVEKKSTAMLFPNAIVISTLHARHVFASFISRDSTYDLIIAIWNVSKPELVQNQTEAHVVADGEDLGSGESALDDDEDEYEDSDDELGESFTDAGDAAFEDERKSDIGGSRAPSRKPSQVVSKSPTAGEAKGGGSDGAGGDFPGPATHAPTNCGDDDQHLDKALCDEIIAAPLGRVYSLLFGPASYNFVNNFLSEVEKIQELSFPNNGEWADTSGKKTRSYTYIRPLAGGIGPKQTRCNITETIETCDLEDHVTVTVTTQTPDVPSGNVFVVKTRYCLMWAEGNETRMLCNCTVEWSGKSWIKGPIEKGASDGQISSNKSLLETLRKELAPKKAAPARGGKGKGGRRRKGSEEKAVAAAPAKAVEAAKAAPSGASWGPLAPLEPILGPIVDILKPLLGGNVGMIIMGGIILVLLISRMRSGPSTPAPAQLGPRWEDVWRSEEASLWEWLEDRVGLDGIPEYSVAGRKKSAENIVGSRFASVDLKERQIDDAVIVMEERLEALKRIIERRKKRSGKTGATKNRGESKGENRSAPAIPDVGV